MNEAEAVCGFYITINTRVIKHIMDNVEAKHKNEVCVNIDGDVKNFTVQEFKERLFKVESCSVGEEQSKEEYLKDPENEQFSLKKTETVPEPVFEKPMQALWVANPEMLADILAGKKRITIRFGHKDYKVDKAVFVVACNFNVVTVAVVKKLKSVKWKKLGDLTEREIIVDGFKDINDALSGLRVFYPEIGLDSPITVVEW